MRALLTDGSTWRWAIIALAIRSGFFAVFLLEHGFQQRRWGWGESFTDTSGYFDPIDHLLAHGSYDPDFRMPGYGAVYLLARLFTTQPGAGNLVLAAQLLLGVCAVVALARIARMLGLPLWAQHASVVAFAFMPRVAVYDVMWYTESFLTSALVLGAHALLSYRTTGSRAALAWSGVWLGWAVFLKPVWLLWWGLACAIAATHGSIRERTRNALLFALPFLIADGCWTLRNQQVHHRLIPFNTATVMPELAHGPVWPLMRLMRATGGNPYYWDRTSEMSWFSGGRMMSAQVPAPPMPELLPTLALCDRITADSLRVLRDLFMAFERNGTDTAARSGIATAIGEHCDRYIGYFAHDEPWRHQVLARLRHGALAWRRAGLSGVFRVPVRHPAPWVAPLRAIEPVLYVILLLGLHAGALVVLLRGVAVQRIIALAVLAGYYVFPLVLRLPEGRYAVPMYPWMLLVMLMAFAALRTSQDDPV